MYINKYIIKNQYYSATPKLLIFYAVIFVEERLAALKYGWIYFKRIKTNFFLFSKFNSSSGVSRIIYKYAFMAVPPYDWISSERILVLSLIISWRNSVINKAARLYFSRD